VASGGHFYIPPLIALVLAGVTFARALGTPSARERAASHDVRSNATRQTVLEPAEEVLDSPNAGRIDVVVDEPGGPVEHALTRR
jgi:hypothetical protein